MGNESNSKQGFGLWGNVTWLTVFVAAMLICGLVMRSQRLEEFKENSLLFLQNYATTEEKELESYVTVLSMGASYMDSLEQEGADWDEVRVWLYPYLEGFYDLYSADSLRSYGVVSGHVIVDNEGYEALEDVTYDYRTADWYIGAMAADGGMYISDAYEDSYTGSICVTLAKKAAHSDSVLAFDILFDNYRTGSDTLDMPENAAYYLCDANGTVMYSQTKVFDNRADMQDFADRMFRQMGDDFTSGYQYSFQDRKGQQRALYAIELENGWRIMYTNPLAEATEGMESFYWSAGLVFLVGLSLVAYLSIRDYRRLRANRRLMQERQAMVKTNYIYQKTMRSTLVPYREVCYLDLVEDTFQVVYPEGTKFPRPTQGQFQSSLKKLLDNGDLQMDDIADAQLISLSDNIRTTLAEQEYMEFRCQYRREDGTMEKCVLTLTVVDRVEGRPVSATVALRSIESVLHQEEAQRELLTLAARRAEAANHAKSDFLSNMSHDIRTPLNAILGMTAIAAMHISEPERVLDALNKISVSGKHLLGLINSVLDMSKIESGKVSLTEEEFSLSDAVDSMLTVVHPQVDEKDLELSVLVGKVEHEQVIGDEQRLQQILLNIMSNAIKFTPERGRICLSIREKPSDMPGRGCYEFVFEDTGIGMSEEFMDKIFEPFARATDSRTSRIEGTGLGMPIALNIARMMDGDIQVESELGKGSRFTVTVHLKLNDVTEEQLHQLADLSVLVVDDELAVCENACEVLQSLEMRAEYALSGDEAIVRVSGAHEVKEDFAVVILDWKMPGKDGVQTAREIRARVGDEVPIIVLTAYDWSEIEQEATAAGVNAFIEKPLFKARLTHVLKQVLGLGETESIPASVEQGTYKGHRVLVVEDNDLNIEVAGELLEMTGLEVGFAYNGRQAVDVLESSEPGYYEMVFMDIQMPFMNGYEATEAIRDSAREDLRHIPIVAMTADAFAEDAQRAMDVGMNGHMSKPVDITKLEKILSLYIRT
jgi:signal transduction histidine kinase/DNA-binding response OmpR family regulator